MKSLLPNVAALLLAFTAQTSLAAESRTYLKTGSATATVTIITEDNSSIQAASYVDGQENSKFVDMMMTDPQSGLAKIKTQLESDICQENSTTPDGLIPGCGRVELSNFVRTSFGRGGWMAAGSTYAFFVGFRSEGSGHFLDSYYMVSITEEAQAQVDSQMNYLGTVKKYLTLERITVLPSPTPP